ncbi:MAG: hypothetical protein LBI92_00800 [Azoarcus sp.]|jgi:hypothetical protein|nr:hypothetical protein [Azoarcus sp.]
MPINVHHSVCHYVRHSGRQYALYRFERQAQAFRHPVIPAAHAEAHAEAGPKAGPEASPFARHLNTLPAAIGGNHPVRTAMQRYGRKIHKR